MLLTQQRDTANYLASMESAYRQTELQLFNNINTTSYPRSAVAGYPVSTTITNPNDTVSKVDYNGSSGQKTGPSLLLKVMSGDTVNMAVQSYYNTNSASATNSSFSDVLNSLAGGIYNATAGSEGTVANFTASGSPVYAAITSLLSANDPPPASGYPRAYLNWVFLDDQFNYISASSGAVSAANSSHPAGTLNTIAPGSAITMQQNGYLYIWVSNETQGWDVFFDNLSVQHRQGPVLEENHYYPGGLVMQGISDRALKSNYAENRYKFHGKELQNKEFADASGLEWLDFGARDYDPQIMRWTTIDPKADKYVWSSPYDFVDDNPVSRIDPTGKDWFYYQGKDDKNKAWHWQKGHKATYVNGDGKSVTTKKGYQYLVTFSYDQGHTSEGAKRGTLTVYNQNGVAVQSTAFSGAGLLTGNFNEAAKGNYTMNLSQRSVMPKVNYNSDNDNANPPPGTGIQKIENGTIVQHPEGSTDNVNSDYGNYRIRLTPTDGSTDRGLYLHGKDRWYNSRTHGCVCEKDQTALQYIWEHPEIKGIVPFAVDEPHDTPQQ